MRRPDAQSTSFGAKSRRPYLTTNKASLAFRRPESPSRPIGGTARHLKDYPSYKLTIEGHCDERGSAEYNMALGDKRAESAKDYLVQVGIPLRNSTWSATANNAPSAQSHDEACWQRNRRAHIVRWRRLIRASISLAGTRLPLCGVE